MDDKIKKEIQEIENQVSEVCDNNKVLEIDKEQELLNEFCDYEISTQLKFIGFDSPCFGFYNGATKSFEYERRYNQSMFIGGAGCLAPTKRQAIKFFRETFQISGHISMWDEEYMYEIEDIYGEELGGNENFKNLVDAERDLLMNLIEIAKGIIKEHSKNSKIIEKHS